MPSLTQAIEKLYTLNVGVTSAGDETRHERPHKPLLLLAVLDLLDEGLATPDKIPWSRELRDRFTRRFKVVQKHNDSNTPENPFHYLQGDGIWSVWKEAPSGSQPLSSPPLVKDIGLVFARFTEDFGMVVALPENRMFMREAIVARYFSGQAEALLEPMTPQEENPAKIAEKSIDFGRNPGFRRKIIEVYDHPTNGLALCKNHHWAMDRHLLAPGPDMTWHVSPILDGRRSNGEKELLELARRAVLSPQESAFLPNEEGLKWRITRLTA